MPSPPTPPPLLRAETDGQQAQSSSRFAMALDVGVPDGAGVGLIVRPFKPLFVSGSVVTNGVAVGVRAGIGVAFFSEGYFRPTVTVDGGRMFEGDGSPLMSAFAPGFGANALTRVRYDFASAHAGLELGTPRLALTLRAGVSYVDARLAGAVEAFGDSAGVEVQGDPVIVRLFHPCVRVGVVQRF